MKEDRIVIKLGGFIFSPKPQLDKLLDYKETLLRLKREYGMVVIAGGGEYARTYIEAARRMGADETFCDELGIKASRLNAELVISCLGEEAYPLVPIDLDELKTASQTDRIIVAGGMFPAQSTDAVSAVVAELIGAKMLVKATDVGGVYTSDPKKDDKARKLDTISVNQLKEMLFRRSSRAGEYELIDLQALRIIERSKIPTVILDGRDPKNIEKAVKGYKIGTRIVFE
ncbi:UMP kinase [Candidatus Bathyarchaeota archaeon]|nr:UMP kinase [Candidatus Bathyarchaeota archaeon]